MIHTNLIPSWPKERDLACYELFTGLDFEKEILDDMAWIDIGCRTGKALSQIRKKSKAILLGVNAHPIRVRPGIISISATLPEDTDIYEKYKNKMDLVTDIHGAVSYCSNPLEALIYEACLLKHNAQAIIVTLEHRMGEPSSDVFKKIENFFKNTMNQTIEFQPFPSYSDNSKTLIHTMRITIKGKCHSTLSLNNLFLEARQYIGEMRKNKVISEAKDKSAQVWQILYRKNKTSLNNSHCEPF